jgi:hypothetical protein
MGRRKATELEVRIAFEASRVAQQCLADAYERLVPIPRRPTGPTAVSRLSLEPAAELPPLRRIERG